MNFNLHFGELHSDNSINDKNNLFENYIPKCYKVKRILISFNCFSEYMWLFPMRTFPASGNLVKLSGSCILTINGFGSTQLSNILCHTGVPTFSLQIKVIKVYPKYLLTSYQN